ncbi:MAG: NAD-dependent DNA ligase LigA [Bdellovibrionaceae bacterium]|nr:NAD-dependent DNA ligase LigA [Pseudobdellovibrionaceae bacterium]
MKKNILKKIQKLKDKIKFHDNLYYNLDQAQITDFEYDKLFQKLQELEKQYPEFKTKDSPSQKIPGKALSKFKKHTRLVPMLSLQNSYSKLDIEKFYQKTLKLLKTENLTFFLEPKLDGMAVELIYEKGFLTRALSRGDGYTGEDITIAMKTLKALPIYIGDKAPSFLEIRGEVLILKKDFERINKEQELAGLVPFASPRNLAAGSLRQLDPKITASRPLYCFIHSPGGRALKSLKTQKAFIEKMHSFSLPAFKISSAKKLKPSMELCCLVKNVKDIINYYEQMQTIRSKLDFEIDGVVIKVNDFEKQKSLGVISRSPRWAIAGKFTPEQGITQIEKIKLQVGRTGVITPVAVLKPLTLAGVQIRHASLHNFKELARKDIREGDFVRVHRAGDVIPEIAESLKKKRKTKTPPFKIPSVCPICESFVVENGDYLFCGNSKCPAVMENKLIHFASKKAMNIEFLGVKSIKKFYKLKWLNSYSDIYDLKDKDLKNQEGFGKKSFQLLINSLEKSKKTTLARFLFALGIPLVGEQTAQKMSDEVYKKYKNKKNLDILSALLILKEFCKQELESVPDIGPIVASSFIRAFKNQNLIKDLKELHNKGIGFIPVETKKEVLKGLNFVITGSFSFPRSKIKSQIENLGAKVSSQISKKTSFLIEGEKPGSKKEKAFRLSVPILNYKEFLRKFDLPFD